MAGLDLVSSLIKVALVFGLLFLTMKGLARHQRRSGRGRMRVAGNQTAMVEVLDQSRLGRSSSVVAVRVGERAFLLGVTDDRVVNLADLTDDVDLVEPDEDDEIERSSVLDTAVDILRTGGFRRG